MTSPTHPAPPTSGVGRIVFVGTGPGDPGLLTVRAMSVLRAATQVVTDPDVAEPILALVAGAEVRPGVGDPVSVAASLVAAARAGQDVHRLVAGDVLTADAVVQEILVVAASGVPFDLIPGISLASAAASYSGVAMGSTHTSADVRSRSDWTGLVGAPGTLLLQAAAGHLAYAAEQLVANGLPADTPASITVAATLPTQRTVDATLATLSSAGRELSGSLVVTIGSGLSARPMLSWWESRALYGWRVLVPRTRDRNDTVFELLRQYGASPEEVATIAVEPPRTPAQMERAIKGLVDGRYQWIVFTSVNAVRAIWEKFTEFGLDARAFSGVGIACADEASSAAVRALGITPDLVAEAQPDGTGSTEALVEVFPEYDEILDPVDRVLLPRADIATETLAEGLRTAGWAVDDVTAYRTVRAAPPPAAVREAIKTGGFDAVLFTSASTVRNLIGIAGKPHGRTVVGVLGPKTAETAREFGLRVDVQPEVPDLPTLVAALAAHAAELRSQGALPPPRRSPKRR